MNQFIAAHAVAAYALAVNALLEDLTQGRITLAEVQTVIARSRVMLASLSTIDPAVLSAADGLLMHITQGLPAPGWRA
jgi:hypothetical protein